jgi:hypothetical protein
MPPFPKPRFDFEYDPAEEIRVLRRYFAADPSRTIPKKQKSRVLIATWNIANLGVQHRREQDYRILAEIISWFDVVAVQEVHANLEGLQGIKSHLPEAYRLLYSDAGGNDERLTFVFDSNKLVLSDEVAEVAPAPKDYKSITLPGVKGSFNGFDRSPYLATFTAEAFTVSLVTAHLFFGSDTIPTDIARRSLEAAAVAWWTNRRHRNKYAPTKHVLALGDMNLPKTDKSDPDLSGAHPQGAAPTRALNLDRVEPRIRHALRPNHVLSRRHQSQVHRRGWRRRLRWRRLPITLGRPDQDRDTVPRVREVLPLRPSPVLGRVQRCLTRRSRPGLQPSP